MSGYQPGAWVVFEYSDLPRTTGQVIEDNACGVIVEGYASGRRYLLGSDKVRPENEQERHLRLEQGYLAEHLP